MRLRRGASVNFVPVRKFDDAGSARGRCAEMAACVGLPAVVAKVASMLEGCRLLPGRKFQSHPTVPLWRLIDLLFMHNI